MSEEQAKPEQQAQDYKPFETVTAKDIVSKPHAKGDILSSDPTQPEAVTIAAKISQIITPYFVVVVGLYLYDDNFLIGVVLVAVGIASLLNFSLEDAKKAMLGVLRFLGLTKS
jgi:hypothetical protein